MPGRELQDHRRVEQMDLYYKSTRNSNLKVTASEAILKGLAPDGGLFVPEKLPVLGKSMEELKDLNYQDTAYEVMKCFLYLRMWQSELQSHSSPDSSLQMLSSDVAG